MMGAVQRMRERTGMSLGDTDFWDEAHKDVRELLGEVADQDVAEYQEGLDMTIDEAVAYALSGG